MSSSGEEEETGPSVDSNDAEERIAARRLRIQRRHELARRAAMGEDPNAKKAVKEEISKSRIQIEQSRQRLTKLLQDGTELVTNIRVAGDMREGGRRIEEEEARRQRKDKLEAENKGGTERFEEISKKWESALQKEIPQDLHEMLKQQQQRCNAMIDEKNKLISEFQQELKGKDEQYVKDLKKQAEEIDLMIERMEEQIKNLTKAYREELTQIEKAFVTERTELLELQRKKWDHMMQQRRDKELEYMKAREKRVDDYEQQLQHLRVQDAEEYNSVKIKLETDVQLLEQQIQLMRATFQLNQEKLEYNFQVLKKRDEENTITKSQQKRKITRLQDVMNTLRIKLAKQEKQFRDENSQLTEDYKRITEQFMELQKKSRHFITTDGKKFTDIWVMNEAEAKELVEKVCEQDRIVTEHQLGLRWDQPDIEFMDNVGPILSEQTRRQQVSATQVVQEVMSQTGGSDHPVVDPVDRPYRPEPGEDEEAGEFHHASMMKDQAVRSEHGGVETVKSTITQKFSAHTIKKILELLCDESGFLVENKLVKLLAPLEQDEQSLMKLDAIFAALGVETEDDIYRLSNFFTKFRQATERAQTAQSRKQSIVDGGKQGDEIDKDGEKKEGEEGTQTDEMADDADVAEELQKVMEEGEEVLTPRSVKSEATELIHPNDVYKALRVFVEEQWQPTKEKTKQPQFKIANTEDRDDADDSAYWNRYSAILPQKTERMWDALLDGLEIYSECLQGRSKLITETDGLRQQNAELRMLLHQYVNSKVNAELEIPPTRVLNLEFQHA